MIAQEHQSSLAVTDDLLSRLVLQPSGGAEFDTCAYYTCANLFAVCGLEPPAVEEMIETGRRLGMHNEMEGLTGSDMIGLLQMFGFPRGLGTLALPYTAGMWGFVKSSLATGFQVLLTVCFVVELSLEDAIRLGDKDFAGVKVWLTHSLIPVLAESEQDAEGGFVRRELSVITNWEVMPITKIKVQEIEVFDWEFLLAGAQPVGISRNVVLIWPDVRAGKGN